MISRKMVDKRVMNQEKRKQGEERRGAKERKERKEKGVVIRRNQWSMSLSKA